jgi:hypothetical protein
VLTIPRKRWSEGLQYGLAETLRVMLADFASSIIFRATASRRGLMFSSVRWRAHKGHFESDAPRDGWSPGRICGRPSRT